MSLYGPGQRVRFKSQPIELPSPCCGRHYSCLAFEEEGIGLVEAWPQTLDGEPYHLKCLACGREMDWTPGWVAVRMGFAYPELFVISETWLEPMVPR